MEHGGAHEGQLPQLSVGDTADGLGVLHNAGVRHQDAGHVRPVFVHVGIDGRRGQGAADVAAAPGHHLNAAIGQAAIETGDHDTAVLLIGSFDGGVSLFPVHLTVIGEKYAVRRVHKLIAKVIGHEPGGQVLTTGHQLIGGHILAEALLQLGHLRPHIEAKVQLVPDLAEALLYCMNDIVA